MTIETIPAFLSLGFLLISVGILVILVFNDDCALCKNCPVKAETRPILTVGCHDKDPFLLKGYLALSITLKRKTYILQPFTSNGNVSI
jgi:hypothetical protein